MDSLLELTGYTLYFSVLMQISVAFVLLLIANYIKNKVVNTAKQKLSAVPNIWNEAVLSAIIWPSSVLIWLLFTSYTLKLLATAFPDQIILTDGNHYIKSIGVIIVLAWFMIDLVANLEKNYFKSVDKDTTLDTASSYLLGKIIRGIILSVSTVVILQTLGYSLTALLTLGGAGSLVAGLAAKDMLSNFFGGLTVYLDKPFKVGDWVKTNDHKLEGTVEKIGWRSTRLRNFEKRPVYVPNSIWATAPVENASRMINRRIKDIIGLRYKDADKIEAIMLDIENMLHEHPGVDHRQNIIVKFNEFGAYSLNFMLYVFTKATKLKDFSEIKQDILLKVVTIVHKNGADFAFPTTTLDIPDEIRVSSK